MSLCTVWRLITHHKDPERMLKWSLINGQVSLGWNRIGPLSQFGSPKEISRAVCEKYPTNINKHVSGPQLWNFAHEMKVGDLVILSIGSRREAVMEVTGEYYFDGEQLDDHLLYCHRRKAALTRIDPDNLWRAAGGSMLAAGQNIRWAFAKCGAPVDRGKTAS